VNCKMKPGEFFLFCNFLKHNIFKFTILVYKKYLFWGIMPNSSWSGVGSYLLPRFSKKMLKCDSIICSYGTAGSMIPYIQVLFQLIFTIIFHFDYHSTIGPQYTCLSDEHYVRCEKYKQLFELNNFLFNRLYISVYYYIF
jgi:hypothetical protein